MQRCLGAVAIWAVLAGLALADVPQTSPRPMPRPVAGMIAPPVVVPPVALALPLPSGFASVRPHPRPGTLGAASAAAVVMAAAVTVTTPPLPGVLRPAKRPDGLARRTLAAAGAIKLAPGKQGVVSKKGAVCGDPAIKGEVLAPITSKVMGCGVANPVKVTSVAGVRLSRPATLDCDTARALKTWVERGLLPAYGRAKVVEMQVAGHYVCRTRNHRPGAKVSEHGKGRAIDIAGFTFSNGKSVSVARNFDRPMRKAHKAACGIFGTTLGPGSDGMHEDHLHFDTAKYRSGSYCR